MKIFAKVILAWVIGFSIYMIAAILTGVMDGFPALLCQPVMALGFSGIFVALALVVKLPLRLIDIEKYKRQMQLINVALLIIGIILLLFSQQLGLTHDQYAFPSGETTGSHPIALAVGYFLIIFPIVNW
jgi:hypothetical protein